VHECQDTVDVACGGQTTACELHLASWCIATGWRELLEIV